MDNKYHEELVDPDAEMEFDNEYKEKSMWIQLGKILDSESAREVVDPKKFKPVNTVVTDDGEEFNISAAEAEVMMTLLRNSPVLLRSKLLRSMQSGPGLTRFAVVARNQM